MTTSSMQKMMQLLNAGKVLRAAFVAQEAKGQGDSLPAQALAEYMDVVVKRRAEVYESLPHDTFKCPHSH